MAFVKTIFFVALVAFVAAQVDLNQQIQQIGNVQNITGAETPVPTDQLPTDQLPTDQLPTDQLPIDLPTGQVSTEAPSAETPNRFANSINRITNSLNGFRGNRRH